MPFDPTLPAFHSVNSSAEMRGQLTSLKALIDALAAQIASLQAQLTAGIAGTSSNTNGVALPGLIVSDPPTQAEMQALADKQEELITTLRR